MQSNVPAKKVEQSERLADDVEAFLAKGGEIYEAQLEDNAFYRNRFKKGRQHVPLVISKKRTAPKHPWGVVPDG